MSKIHEALRRAEQSNQTTSSPVLDVLMDASPARLMPDGDEFPEMKAAPDFGDDGTRGKASPEMEKWLARCVQHTWTPNAEKVLFAGADELHSVEHEQFRTLRSRLYQLRTQQPLKTLLIGSALASEGKTFVAVNLALVLARQHGRRVLLIDCDLRRPRLHALLGAPASPGLTDYLSGRSDEASVMQKAPLQNLYFMPGGTVAPNPSELIGTGRMAGLIGKISSLFDWIIIDTPPVIPVSDATILAEACDGVILVLKAGSTPYDIVQKARDEFRRAPVVGVVLNRATKSHSYGAYYYELYGNEQVAGGGKG